MSLGYAEKLSYKEDIGTVGMSEIFDPPDVLQEKIEELAMMIQKSKHLVAFTGAGISTSCGIPDFRGPKGVWTLQREGKGVPEASLPFHRAMPSLTHMALVELEKAGILKFVISQNIDSLHLRSGIPREKLSELHGNSFRELCPSCGAEYVRDFEVETIGMKETSRRCSDEKCGAKLRDTVLDWDDALPVKEIDQAEKHCRMADIVLCLGTSLQITPACNLPLKSIRGGGKVVIINLQATPKDKKASLVIHGFVDKVITGVLHFLNLRIPPYVRIDFLEIIFKQSCRIRGVDSKFSKWTLKIGSVHGQKAPLPFLRSVEVCFPERPELKTAILSKPPFRLKREMLKARPLKMLLTLKFSEGCGCAAIDVDFPVDFEIPEDSFKLDKETVLQELRDSALRDWTSGKCAAIERTVIPDPRTETTHCAIVTSIVGYDRLFQTYKSLGGCPKNNGKLLKRGKELNGTKTPPKRLKGY